MSYDKNTWVFPLYQLINALTASLFPLGATIISLLYALNQKERQFCMDAKNYDAKLTYRSRTARESMRSMMEEDEDSLVLGDSEVIKAIGATVDDVKLTP